MKRVLIASDLSERSRRTLKRALALAQQFGSQLSILHVVDDDKP
jgi:nucleotide-binding universal stress UspA family protein